METFNFLEFLNSKQRTHLSLYVFILLAKSHEKKLRFMHDKYPRNPAACPAPMYLPWLGELIESAKRSRIIICYLHHADLVTEIKYPQLHWIRR